MSASKRKFGIRRKCYQLWIGLLVSMSLLLTSCALPGLGSDVKSDGIIIAGGNTTERQILAEVVAQMCQHYLADTNPRLINNLGSTMLIVQALEREDANVSGAMYTGTSLTGELGLESITNADKAIEEVVKGYHEKYNMVWFPSYGFGNTYSFMVSKKLSVEKGITKVSDLEKYANEVRVGVDTGWLDRQGDGYQGFQNIYGFSFASIRPMEIGLVYDAVKNEEMDVVLGYSTDGRINAYDLVLLQDDKQLFPSYDASPVVTKRLLQKYPELETILLKLEGEISSETMQYLNRISDEQKVEPSVIANQFLEEHNYFEGKDVLALTDRALYHDIVQDILPISQRGGEEK
ncbi:osmoprotectant ABC transporter substrate-binding protein [Lachnospiraceae bacterium LCP25S3_G4]